MKQKQDKQQKQKAGILQKPLVRRLILVLAGLILGCNLYFANASGLAGNQLPMPFGYGLANVLSGSMEPTFSKGTLLLVKKTESIAPGDIVVYQSGRELIVHRVIEISGDTVITQGDANNISDPAFSRSQIKGTVIGWIPYLGTAAGLLKTPLGIFLVLLCAFLLIEGSFRRQKEEDSQEIEAIKDEIRRLKEEKKETEK